VVKESFCCNYVHAVTVVYIHEDRQITSGQLDKRSGIPCDEPTSHQGRGGGNTPSRFVPQKPEMTADTNESSDPGPVQSPRLNGLHVCSVQMGLTTKSTELNLLCQIFELTRCG